MGVQNVPVGVANAELLASATRAVATAANFKLFIILSFSSLILNGDQMKASLIPSLHVLL